MEVHSGKIDLWQGCHKMGEESSKIVPLAHHFIHFFLKQLRNSFDPYLYDVCNPK